MHNEALIWSIFGGLGTMLLGLIATGIVALVKATIGNTAELKVLSEAIKKLSVVTEKVEQIQSDVDQFHSWKREHIKRYP